MMNSDRDAGRRRTLGREETLEIEGGCVRVTRKEFRRTREYTHDVFFCFSTHRNVASQVAKSDAREGETKESRNMVRDAEASTGEGFWSGLCGVPKSLCSKSTKGDWRKPKSRDEEESFSRFAVMKRDAGSGFGKSYFLILMRKGTDRI